MIRTRLVSDRETAHRPNSGTAGSADAGGQQSHPASIRRSCRGLRRGATFPPERWATTFRSVAQLVLFDIAESYGYPPPDLAEFLYLEAKQPAPSRVMLFREVSAELCSGF